MVGWYWRLHSWNRILLTAVVAALATTAILGTLTIERATVLPFVTAFIWGSGWVAILARRHGRNLWASGFCAPFRGFARVHLNQA